MENGSPSQISVSDKIFFNINVDKIALGIPVYVP